MKTVHEYGEPCFRDGSTRSFEIISEDDQYLVFYKTLAVQGVKEGEGNPDEAILSVFEEYRNKMKKEDKKLFKTYFDGRS